MVSQIQLSHMPPELALYAALYTEVENAAFLKEQLHAGNAEFEYAFIDATMIISTRHALAAAFRAMNDYLHDRLKSRNIHSETVFALSPNNNIGEAFRRFGVQESTRDLLVLKVLTDPETTEQGLRDHLASSIKGNEVAFDDAEIQKSTDLGRLKKSYKIGSGDSNTKKAKAGSVNGFATGTDDYQSMEVQILGAMALRGAT